MCDARASTVAHHGFIRYTISDNTIPPQERAFYSIPMIKTIADYELEIHDFRRSEDIVKGSKGLDVQGFTVVEHETALSKGDDTWFLERNLEEI
jgi:hypothetical protein